MNILVTGCNGQLGNEIQLLEKENPQHCFFNTDVEELDITDQLAVEQFVAQNKIEGIINCAAYTAVDKAESNKELCTSLNTVAPAYLAAAIDKRNGWMIHISTDYVFDGTKHTPYVEDDTPCPNSVYGSTKLAGELGVRKFCKKAMIIRTAWLYSTFGNNFVKTMIRLGKEKEQLGVIFDQIGTPTYARDLAVVIMTAINKGIKPDVYHFSNEGVISWYDFTKAIHRIAGIDTCHVKPLHTTEYPTPASRPAYSVLDKTKLKNAYGIEIPYWEESLAECIKKLV
ncbi:MAG: dTDP-4-dehydrorhamnose reductase [Prevotella sp.]|jgi:dTDP-4-dehydrorhamnose reductase|nr:dTDP-4-dehydrorhamnose reductase [Prevotella sp.]MBQ2333926.1 dTDP-4-dehydrorhamnose reductase [Prevotella sp.]MBQ2360382.1 dTDP-4-dehydrorhamnose reductase [Prevotella sp.]MBQ2495379.1 dTDP-4-dehydrorhamnose reductase [Prevotella sp.]MBQ4173300.1 dTDP-4-dehydrorhamnose reductase [Prevotella sp.]